MTTCNSYLSATPYRNILNSIVSSFGRYRPNIRNRQFDPREEFPVSEELLNRVDFSPRVAELQRMVLERTGSNVPSLQFLLNNLSRWSGTMRMTVRELMSEKPVTISPACTAEQALDKLYEYETPELYVVEKSGRFLGILPGWPPTP